MKKDIENKASLYEDSIREKNKGVFTEEDEQNNPHKKAGIEYTFLPIPTTPLEAFDRLVNLTAQTRSEFYQKQFFETYPEINKVIFDSELEIIEKFINMAKADKTTLSLAMKTSPKNSFAYKFSNEEMVLEFLRLENHYYKTKMCQFEEYWISCEVYGKYILFYNWLKQQRTLHYGTRQVTKNIPKTFEELFHNPSHASICLDVLKKIQPPILDYENNYIGKSKGVLPLWIKILKSHYPKPLIKHYSDMTYKNILNEKISNLNLSPDASEFRKYYKRLETNKTELNIKTILSQFSQEGKLGK